MGENEEEVGMNCDVLDMEFSLHQGPIIIIFYSAFFPENYLRRSTSE